MKKIQLIPFILVVFLFISACQPVAPKAKKESVQSNAPLQINTKELPVWQAPGSATYKLDVAGGVPPYSFSIAGSLPEGFNIGPDGTIGGLARLPEGTSKSDSPPFTVIVKDSAGNEAQASFTISLVEKNTVQIITTPAACTVNQDCDESIATATGGTPPYSFQSDTFMEGAPPFGTIVDVNGHLTGKPSREGVSTIGVCVKDTIGNQRCGKAVITIQPQVEPQVTITSKNCKLLDDDTYSLDLEGTVTAPVGSRIMAIHYGLTYPLVCPSWDERGGGATIHTCVRRADDPETTQWSFHSRMAPGFFESIAVFASGGGPNPIARTEDIPCP